MEKMAFFTRSGLFVGKSHEKNPDFLTPGYPEIKKIPKKSRILGILDKSHGFLKNPGDKNPETEQKPESRG